MGGCVRPPVRAWRSILSAERFSKQTGRRIILRLTLPDEGVRVLAGHRGEAVVYDGCLGLDKCLW